ncbi:MAG: class I SAM-dependent methyltransferase [Hyphomicrobiales bacterium]|nr:class I SAM-dependent methyltransferase [Hyphomicrobiales bacterium]
MLEALSTRSDPERASFVLACPACGRATPHCHRFHKNGCDVLQCRVCGLGRADARTFDPTSYYTLDYFNGRHADGYADYVGAEPVLRQEFARTVAHIRRFRASGRLLELGCAYGFFLQEAQRYFAVCGIELAPEAAQHCRRAGLDVRQGVADASTLARLGPVDIVVMLDVIEHLPEPEETLALCSRHLAPGGILLITTGDFGSALARLSGSNWRLMTPPQHLWYFTAESMARLGARLGLRLAQLDHPGKTVPASLILFQLRRILGLGGSSVPAGSRIGIPVNLYDAMRVVFQKPQ